MSSSPRILLVTQQLRATRSGVGLYARLLAIELMRRGHRIAVATWSDEIDPQLDIPWLDLGTAPPRDPTPGAFFSLGRRAAAAIRVRDDFDLVHFLDAREGYAAVREGRFPFIGTVHDDYAARAPRTPFPLVGRSADPFRRWAYYTWLRWLERRCYARFDLLLANATETGRCAAEAYDLAPDHVRRVQLGIARSDSAMASPADLSGAPALLFAGGNFYRKGLDTVIRALSRPELDGAHLHVAGHDPARRRVEALARRLGVADAVTFHGRVGRDVMEGLMAGADVFVMPSRTEGFGLVYLEASRAGTPVVSGNVGGVTEVVRHGESGLCVPPEDPAELAAAIASIHADPELAARLVAGGQAVLAEHTVGRMVDETVAAYEQALGRSLG